MGEIFFLGEVKFIMNSSKYKDAMDFYHIYNTENQNCSSRLERNDIMYWHIGIAKNYDINETNLKKIKTKIENNDLNFIVIDIETTGLCEQDSEIISLSAIKIINGKIAEKFEELVKPRIQITELIENLTGITNDMLKSKDNICSILPRFIEFCGQDAIVAHNMVFHMRFINKYVNELKLDFVNPVIDLLPVARELLPKLKNFKLGTISKRLHVKGSNDTEKTAKVLLKSIRKIESVKQ